MGLRLVSRECSRWEPLAAGWLENSFPAVNYEDPNINIAIPVFSIHGNHDDPQGTGPVCSTLPLFPWRVWLSQQEGALCALDVLSVSGVLNYFGKSDLVADENAADNPEKGIQIRPVLLRKGTTHVALYGCGNIRDQRMYQELRANKVKMFMPTGGNVPDSEWFNILLVHQNRWVDKFLSGSMQKYGVNTIVSAQRPTWPSELRSREHVWRFYATCHLGPWARLQDHPRERRR